MFLDVRQLSDFDAEAASPRMAKFYGA